MSDTFESQVAARFTPSAAAIDAAAQAQWAVESDIPWAEVPDDGKAEWRESLLAPLRAAYAVEAPRVAAAIRAANEKHAELTAGALVVATVHGVRVASDAAQQIEAAALSALQGAPHA